MSESTALPPKREVANALLEQSSVFIHLDPRKPEVLVPAWFKKQAQLVLQIGLNMPVPIRDLLVDDAGIQCTLSFNRSPHFCRVPWSCVYALVGENGRGMVWPEDVPPEVARAQAPPPAAAPARLRAVDAPKKQARRVEPLPAPAAEVREQAERPTEAGSGGRGLKLVPEKPAKPTKLAGVKGGKAARRTSPKAAAAAPKEPAGPPKAKSKPKPVADKAGSKKKDLPPYLRVVK